MTKQLSFRIDELVNGKTLYEQLGGSELIIKLSTEFYARVMLMKIGLKIFSLKMECRGQ